MFERLDACVLSVFGKDVGKNTRKISHDLCDLFWTENLNFTNEALQYWNALKSGPKAITELLQFNCKIDFERSNGKQQLVLTGRSKFSKFLSNEIWKWIKATPSLHCVQTQVEQFFLFIFWR